MTNQPTTSELKAQLSIISEQLARLERQESQSLPSRGGATTKQFEKWFDKTNNENPDSAAFTNKDWAWLAWKSKKNGGHTSQGSPEHRELMSRITKKRLENLTQSQRQALTLKARQTIEMMKNQ